MSYVFGTGTFRASVFEDDFSFGKSKRTPRNSIRIYINLITAKRTLLRVERIRIRLYIPAKLF